MTRARWVIVAAVGVVALFAAVLLGSRERPRSNLVAGAHLVFSLDLPHPERADLEAAMKVIRARLDTQAGETPSVTLGPDGIVVDLPGADRARADRIIALITRAVRFELKLVDDGSVIMHALADRIGAGTPEGVTADTDSWSSDAGARHDDPYLRATDRGPLTGAKLIEHYVTDLSTREPALALPPERQLAFEHVDPPADASDQRPYWRSYLVERSPRLTGAAIARATPGFDDQSRRPVVTLELTVEGARTFEQLTGASIGRKLAITLDDEVKSAPVIRDAIAGGRVVITLGGMDPAAQVRQSAELVAVFTVGALPARIVLESETIIGPGTTP